MDGDGDVDYVAGNMGLNYTYKPSDGAPLELFAADFDDNDKLDFVFGHYQDGQLYPFANLRKAVLQNNSINRKFSSNQLYAGSTLYDIFGREALENAYHQSIQTLKSGYIENLGNGKFKFKPFDNYAQISNITSIVIKDFDKDGHEDLIMGGNLYSMEAETIRNDASIGVWMKGNGQGLFESVRLAESGLNIDGDVRSIREVKTVFGNILLVAKNNDNLQAVKTSDALQEHK